MKKPEFKLKKFLLKEKLEKLIQLFRIIFPKKFAIQKLFSDNSQIRSHLSVNKFLSSKNSRIIVVLLFIFGVLAQRTYPIISKASASAIVYVNGYPTLNGNYIDCDGTVDNDLGHHVISSSDTDPAHHLGQNCAAGSLVGSSSGSTVVPPTQSPPVQVVPLAQQTLLASQVPNVWWPTSGVSLSGIQPFKTVLVGQALDNYKMYWQVDGGSLTLMSDSYVDSPHKESSVDLSGWNWHSNGSYVITFVATNNNGQQLGSVSVSINIPNSVAASSPTQSLSSTAISSSADVFAGAKLYVNPYSDAQNQVNSWKLSDAADAVQMQKVANGAETEWFGNWNSDVKSDVNNIVTTITKSGALPVLVAYNIPNRDCGGYSAGGTSSASDYQQWINQFAAGIGNRKAAVILEPDATALTDCLSASDLQARYTMLKNAVTTLKHNGQSVYIDAGHPDWISASDMAARLEASGISQADGFALNIANFYSTADNISYGQQISSLVGGKHFIIDTGRNGSGPAPDAEWCNPSGRALGQQPTTNTGNSLVDAFLWVKGPGGSDGTCNGGPSAGTFWASYALGLAQRASW